MARACPSTAWRRGFVLLAALLHQGPALASSLSARGSEDLCRPAAMAAEIDAELPQGLLLAIARVESGRRDPASGAAIPWPWSINAEGVPMIFNTRGEAVAAVEALRARDVRSIDVGCMQVNLHHHPNAFSSLAEAFDPAVNARYAARFLSRLRDSSGDWETAIGRYHSSTPGLSDRYRARVLAAWSGASQRSPADLQRDRIAAAWAGARTQDRQLHQPATADREKTRGAQDRLEKIASLWQRTRQDGAKEVPPFARALPEQALRAGLPAPRNLQISTR